MASFVYNSFKKFLMEKSIDLINDTIKVALVSDSYTPDADGHVYFDDVSAYEITGTNYTAGGETVTNKTTIQDNTDNEGVFDADDITWATASFTTRYGVIYKYNADPAAAPLIGCLDFSSNQSPAAQDFKVQWNSEGVLNLT